MAKNKLGKNSPKNQIKTIVCKLPFNYEKFLPDGDGLTAEEVLAQVIVDLAGATFSASVPVAPSENAYLCELCYTLSKVGDEATDGTQEGCQAVLCGPNGEIDLEPGDKRCLKSDGKAAIPSPWDIKSSDGVVIQICGFIGEEFTVDENGDLVTDDDECLADLCCAATGDNLVDLSGNQLCMVVC